MQESKKVCLFGYSGHAYVVIESLLDAGYQVKGYFDFSEANSNPYHLRFLGFEKEVDIKSIVGNDLVFPAVGENKIRKKLITFFESFNLRQFVAIDPSANISKTSRIAASTYIGKNVSINAMCAIGKGAIINTGSIIEHECVVGDFVHIAPCSVLCGNVTIGNNTLIGANTVVIPNTSIEKDITVGAGTIVVKNLNQQGTWVGNPARIL